MIVFLLLFAPCIVGMPMGGTASAIIMPTHMDTGKLPRECFSCHAGHGMGGTPMLKGGTSMVCLSCHGSKARVTRVGGMNTLMPPDMDIETALLKPYHHPFDAGEGYDAKGAKYPQTNPRAPRRADCGDCHDVHASTEQDPLARVDGINSYGLRAPVASHEYEICFKCHADSANLPDDERNMRLLFNPQNPSFHPVEGPGKGHDEPSLIAPLTAGSVITCSDCHGDDDSGGPKGPHGSDYAAILAANYIKQDGPETSNEYALCYKCHDRNSILRDQSFPCHNLHIVKVGASCFDCHDAHGSTTNAHLIHFNPDEVFAPPAVPSAGQSSLNLQAGQAALRYSALPLIGETPLSRGGIELGRYVDLGNGHGECFLTCHGKVHNPLSY